ncbi:26S proteasome non-ATPase regulatory subunit 10-like [Scyliorhinus canicula]|uniref:26S proteasome non-ATPase regulatory subunit 10-like n=1 Tax=Scyliorhinus canicula TaxID=7830 RepID=UPI0018F42A2F|nr:26S proteasome non-ATPase regulatory subunit 10-like [Scyliorhinus canicula]
MSETSSISSGSTVGSGSRVLQLASKGEWCVLEQSLKSMDKGDRDIILTDEESGLTLLLIAVRESKLTIVERLFELGANQNDRSKDGRSALHIAAAHSKDEIVRLLLAKKLDPNLTGGRKMDVCMEYQCSIYQVPVKPLKVSAGEEYTE